MGTQSDAPAASAGCGAALLAALPLKGLLWLGGGLGGGRGLPASRPGACARSAACVTRTWRWMSCARSASPSSSSCCSSSALPSRVCCHASGAASDSAGRPCHGASATSAVASPASVPCKYAHRPNYSTAPSAGAKEAWATVPLVVVMQHHAASCNVMQHHSTSCNTWQTSTNASQYRAKPLPLGSHQLQLLCWPPRPLAQVQVP